MSVLSKMQEYDYISFCYRDSSDLLSYLNRILDEKNKFEDGYSGDGKYARRIIDQYRKWLACQFFDKYEKPFMERLHPNIKTVEKNKLYSFKTLESYYYPRVREVYFFAITFYAYASSDQAEFSPPELKERKEVIRAKIVGLKMKLAAAMIVTKVGCNPGATVIPAKSEIETWEDTLKKLEEAQ